MIVPANHVYADPEVLIRLHGLSKQGISIGDDVWIGVNCVVLDEVRVGSGSVIAAGTTGSSDVPPKSIFAGVPGKVIRKRG